MLIFIGISNDLRIKNTLILLFISLISIAVVYLEYTGNFQLKIFGDALQDSVKSGNKMKVYNLYKPFADLMLYKLLSITLKSVSNFASRKYIFFWRLQLTEYFLKHWDIIHSIEGVSQRIQEDTMRFCKLFETLFIFLMQDLFLLLAYLPLLTRLSSNIVETWFIPKFNNILLIIILFTSCLGTLVILIPSMLLTKYVIKIDKAEASFRKELVLCELDEDQLSKVNIDETYKRINKIYHSYYNRYFSIKLVQMIYSQFATISYWLFAHPSMVPPYSLGLLKQTMDAFDQVSIIFNFIVANFRDLVELLAVYLRLNSVVKCI